MRISCGAFTTVGTIGYYAAYAWIAWRTLQGTFSVGDLTFLAGSFLRLRTLLEGLLAGPSSGLIYEGARRIIERDRVGFGVMVFPDDIFKYTSNMIKHLPELAAGTQA